MFYHIEGTVSEILPNLAVVDCGGVGYAINTTANSLSQISLGKTAKFYTFDYIKEDCFDLYGFTTKQEKHSFELLISISGVGPKAAISILSCTTPEMFAMAVMSDDVKVLTAAPGIGKKIAQRVILELKDKISKETDLSSVTFTPTAATLAGSSDELNNAIKGLSVLGYGSDEINQALRGQEFTDKSAEDIIKLVLKQMVK